MMAKYNRVNHHAPLNLEDTPTQTLGCRHTNPDICSKNMMVDVCAFVREDSICKSPPCSWPKQFENLKKVTRPEDEA